MKTYKTVLVHADDLDASLNTLSSQGYEILCVVHEPAYELFYRVVAFIIS